MLFNASFVYLQNCSPKLERSPWKERSEISHPYHSRRRNLISLRNHKKVDGKISWSQNKSSRNLEAKKTVISKEKGKNLRGREDRTSRGRQNSQGSQGNHSQEVANLGGKGGKRNKIMNKECWVSKQLFLLSFPNHILFIPLSYLKS